MDVRVKMTFQFSDSVDKQIGLNLDNDVWDAGIVECLRRDEECHQERAGGHLLGRPAVLRPVRYSSIRLLLPEHIGIWCAAPIIFRLGPGSLAIAYFGGIRSGTGDF